MDNPKKLSIAKMLIMIASAIFLSVSVQAQQQQPDSDGKVVTNATVKGTVLDEVGPVIGASVMVKGTKNGVITDFEGKFTLSGVSVPVTLEVAFLGMATIYAEATAAQVTRTTDSKGNIQGGPVYYITHAFKGGLGKFLAGFFAVAIIIALGLIGCMVQSNSIGSTINTAFGIPSWIAGVVLVVICGFIFMGGVDRLASVTEKPVKRSFPSRLIIRLSGLIP